MGASTRNKHTNYQTMKKQRYTHECQLCGEIVERTKKRGSFTCFNCKARRNHYLKKKKSMLNPASLP